MKQVAQRPRDGAISVVDVPSPALRPGWLLVANRYSLISAGTERTKIVTGEKNLCRRRARALTSSRRSSTGLGSKVSPPQSESLVTASRPSHLSGTRPPASCSKSGAGVEGLAPGDRVACGGGGWANHAEIIAVPRISSAAVPEGVALDDAAYATVGAIALHGIRQCDAEIGEWVGVIGLGLVGQLAARILNAAGCHVVGIDLDTTAVELARRAGAAAFERGDPGSEAGVRSATGGLGLDAVVLCASSDSPDPLELAVRLARDRGRLVVVGETRIDVDRALMYEKELELRMSRSYGPGRYDREYEERGRELAGRIRPLDRAAKHACVSRSRRDGTGLPARSHDPPLPGRGCRRGVRSCSPAPTGGVRSEYCSSTRRR